MQVEGTNGVSTLAAPIAPATPPPPAGEARAQRRAAARAAFLNGSAVEAEEAPEKQPSPADPEKPSAPAAEPPPPKEEPEDDDTEPAAAELEDAPKAEGTPAKQKVDAETQKRLDIVQKAEKRAREAVAAERATFAKEREAFESERKEWQGRIERFQTLEKRAKYDPAAVLRELGIAEDDFEAVARDIYRKSPKAAADPRNREAAAKSAAEREQADRLAKLEAKLAEREKADAEREERVTRERSVAERAEAATKAVASASAPLVAQMLAKNPAKTRLAFAQMTEHALRETGELPDEADLIEALEGFRRAELEDLGIDPSVVAAPPKTKTLPADETKTAPTLSSDLGTPTKPRPPRLSREERRRATIAELERGGRAR